MRKRVLFLILLLVTACRSTCPIAAPADTPGPAEQVVKIAAADGLELVGTFYQGQGEGARPGVLLLHMLGSDRHAWADLVPRLTEAGYAVLALDMRGHGDTGGALDWVEAADDVQRAWRYLTDQPGVDASRTAIVGASIGANLSLVTGAAEPGVKTVVLLSPGLDYRGVTTADAMAAFGDRPALIVASSGDAYAADSSRQLVELAQSADATLHVYEGAAHGTAMFQPQPDLLDMILDWLGRFV